MKLVACPLQWHYHFILVTRQWECVLLVNGHNMSGWHSSVLTTYKVATLQLQTYVSVQCSTRVTQSTWHLTTRVSQGELLPVAVGSLLHGGVQYMICLAMF